MRSIICIFVVRINMSFTASLKIYRFFSSSALQLSIFTLYAAFSTAWFYASGFNMEI